MPDTSTIVMLVCGAVVVLVLRVWWRRRHAGKLADQLLDEVLRGKDAFRR
jgi:hypothetical protein